MKLRIILSTLNANDWRCKTPEEANDIAIYIKRNIKAKDIVLLHDDNSFVIDILDQVLPFFKNNNFDLSNGINSI